MRNPKIVKLLSPIFSFNLSFLGHFQQSAVLTFYLPFSWGHRWGVVRCSTPFSTRKTLTSSEMNGGPLSVLSVWGTPKRANIGWRLLMISAIVVYYNK